jgi:hypothetical protein
VVVLLALVVADLWTVDRRFKVVVEPDRFIRPDPLLARFMREGETEKFRVMPARPDYSFNEMGVFGIESTLGFHDNELAWYRELRTAPAADNLLAANESGYPFLRMLNVKYVLHQSPDFPNPLPVAGYLPRARFVEAWEVADDRASIPPRIADPAFDLAGSVILEEAPELSPRRGPGPPGNDAGAGVPQEPTGRVAAYDYRGNEIRFEVAAPRDGLLVHAENWFPYWTARVDGEPAPILRANGTLRAVPVPAGSREVVMRFRSAPYELGKAITLTTLAAAALAGIAAGFARRRAESPR